MVEKAFVQNHRHNMGPDYPTISPQMGFLTVNHLRWGSHSEAARHGDAGLQPVRNRLLHYHVNGPLHDGRTLNSGARRG